MGSLKSGEVSQPIKTQYGYHVIQTEGATVQVPAFETQKARLTAEVAKNQN